MTVFGRVTGTDNKSVPGITVAAVVERPDSAPAVEIAAKTTTNDDGEYYFSQLRMPSVGGRIRCSIIAYKKDTLLGVSDGMEFQLQPSTEPSGSRKPVPQGYLNRSEVQSFRVFPLGPQRGKVVDLQNKPVSGVTVLPRYGSMWKSPLIQAATGVKPAVTDKRGRFVFAKAPGNPSWGDYRTEKPGYVSANAPDYHSNGVLFVTRPYSVTGRIIDKSGRPLVGVMLEADAGDLHATTAQDGTYTFTGLPQDNCTIFLGPSPSHVIAEGLRLERMKPGLTKVPDMVAVKGAEVSGRVTVARVGEPVRGWVKVIGKNNVWAYPYGHRDFDADGSFKLWLAPGKTYRLECGSLLGWKGDLDIEVPQGGLRGLELEGKFSWTAGYGTVVDEAGSPVPDTEVYIIDPEMENSSIVAYGYSVTNSAGRFGMALHGPLQGKAITVKAVNVERHLGVLRNVSLAELESGNLVLVLRPTASVKLVFKDTTTKRPVLGVRMGEGWSPRGPFSDLEGRLILDKIPAGGVNTLYAGKEGYKPAVIELAPVESKSWRDTRVVWLTRVKRTAP